MQDHNRDDDVSKQPGASSASSAAAKKAPQSDPRESSESDAHQSIISSLNDVPKFSREWFQLKEREISLRNGMVADGDDAVEKNGDASGAQTLLTEDDNAPMLEAQTGANNENTNNADTIEVLTDDNTPLPAAHVGVIHERNNNADNDVKEKMKKIQLEQMPSEKPPMPVSTHEEDDVMAEKKRAAVMPPPTLSDDHCDIAANNSNVENREGDLCRVDNSQLTSRQIQFLNSSTQNESPTSNEAEVVEISNTDIEAQRQTNVSSMGNTSLNPTILDLDASISVIPEAFLVEDDDEKDVAIAKLVPPIWKRKRFYAAILLILIGVISSVVGGVRYVRLKSSQKEIVFVTNETTAAPSVSSAPSVSQMPSFQPSACVDQSSLDPKSLEFIFFNMSQPLTAIEGKHSVVVDIHLEDQSVYMYVVFYKLTKFGTWDKTQYFVELLSVGNDTDLGSDSWLYDSDWDWNDRYSLAMSKNTVLVGAPFAWNGTGIVSTYEYNDKLGEWLRPNEPIKPDDGDREGRRFGQSLALDDDLAVITAPGDETVFIFLRGDKSWNQMTTIPMANTTDVVVNNNTIGLVVGCQLHLYIYNRKFDLVVRNQQFLKDFCFDDGFGGTSNNIGSVALSANHLAVSAFYGAFGQESSGNGCWNPYLRAVSLYSLNEITLYYRPDEFTDFTFVQMLNSSEYGQGFSRDLALDDDFLVIAGSGNQSHAFVFNDEYWEESLALTTPDRCGYDGYDDTLDISGRMVMLTTSDEVYMYNVDECASMPTSTPSESPSSNPTTTCFMIEVYTQHYHAKTPAWTVEQLNETISDDSILAFESSAPTSRPTWVFYAVVGYDPFKSTSSRERKCLQEGTYEFTIYNDPSFYNLTSYGNLIAEGYEPGYKESTKFQVPF